ncbi:unnamed protein product [Heterobilharzia americana]|nr:unnamed protein product [Heterobilharzia americana]CAH8543674.1 unnamed protein product [Heterobilharzia americana]
MLKILLQLFIGLYIIGNVFCDENENSPQIWSSSELSRPLSLLHPYKRRQIFRYGKRNSYPITFKEVDEFATPWRVNQE